MLICSLFNTPLHSSQHIRWMRHPYYPPISNLLLPRSDAQWRSVQSNQSTWQNVACWRLTLLMTENSVISLYELWPKPHNQTKNSSLFASCNTTTQIPTNATRHYFAELPLPPIGALPPMGALPPIGALPPTGPLLAIGDFPPIGPLPPMPFMPPIGALPPPLSAKPWDLVPGSNANALMHTFPYLLGHNTTYYTVRTKRGGNQKAVGFQENIEEEKGINAKLKRISTSLLTLPLSPPLPPLSLPQLPPPPPHEFIIMLIMFIIPLRHLCEHS